MYHSDLISLLFQVLALNRLHFRQQYFLHQLCVMSDLELNSELSLVALILHLEVLSDLHDECLMGQFHAGALGDFRTSGWRVGQLTRFCLLASAVQHANELDFLCWSNRCIVRIIYSLRSKLSISRYGRTFIFSC